MIRRMWEKALDRRDRTAEWLGKRGISLAQTENIFTIVGLAIGIIALFTLVWSYVRPVQLANIKVPVATDRASYAPGEEIAGIFFGEIYYSGEVRVLREVFCKGYKNVILPPDGNNRDELYSTQSVPRKIEGLTVTIGNLPENIPVGLNCVLQFTNVYRIQTPFGARQEEYQYYTQNFSIAGNERVENTADDSKQSSPDSPEPESATTEATSKANGNQNGINTQNRNNEPAPRFEERCLLNFIVKIGCRQVEV